MNSTAWPFHGNSLEDVLDVFGKKFKFQRLYIFKKIDDHYDCTTEWCYDPKIKRIDTLQNLSKETVSFYYQYFNNQHNLIVRNMSQLYRENIELYIVLSIQKLKSTTVVPLFVNGEDLGFIGIDNLYDPLFEETVASLELLAYFVGQQFYLENKKKEQ